jgi:hypothetical protein
MVSPITLWNAVRSRSASGQGRLATRNDFVKSFVELCGGISEVAGMSGLKADAIKNSLEKDDGVFIADGKIAEYTKDIGADDATTEGLPFVARYNTIMTTSDRDREGDILRSDGAQVDPNMPALWQHCSFMPIGRIIRTVSQDANQVTIRNGLANVGMIGDVMALMEVNALRTSHGFRAIEYCELKDDNGNYLGGYDFKKYGVMESSLVSVPANAGAVITAWEKQKFTHPIVKAYGQGLFRSRQPIVKGGWPGETQTTGGVSVSVTINNPNGEPVTKAIDATNPVVDAAKPAAAAADAAAASAQVPAPDATKAAAAAQPAEGKKAGTTPEVDSEEKRKKENNGAADGPPGDGTGTDNTTETITDQNEGTKPAQADPSGIAAKLREAAGADGMPVEAKGRLTLAADMLDDFGIQFGSACDALAEAAQKRDIGGIVVNGSLCMSCSSMLPGIVEEIGRAAMVEGLPETAGPEIASAAESLNGIMDMMAAVNDQIGGGDADPNADVDTTITATDGNGGDDGDDDDDDDDKDEDDESSELFGNDGDDDEEEEEKDDEEDDDKDDKDDEEDDEEKDDDDEDEEDDDEKTLAALNQLALA